MVERMKHIVNKPILVSIIFSVMFFSCSGITDPPEKEDPGITVYKLKISDDQYGEFVSNEFSGLEIPGKLCVDGEIYDVKIKHHGFSSRGRFKKNYSIEFETSDPVLQSKNVIMSGQSTDPSLLRLYLATDVFKEAGLKVSLTQPVVFYINDVSQGLYYLIEPIDEEFFIKRGIKVGELYKAINGNAKFSFRENKELRNGFEKRIPEDDSYYTLEQLITTIDNEPDETFPQKIEQLFEVDKYLRYMAVSVLMCNWDGIVHNYHLYKDQTTGKYEIIPYDLDFTFNIETNQTAFPGSSSLLKKLLGFQKYRDMYKQYFYEYMNGCFSISHLSEKIDEMKQVISKAYLDDRWLQANGYDLNVESEKIKEYLKERHIYIKEQLNNF
jgi:spore coat protein H